eukprot:COSAG02_NODE_240_length_27672_cov_67.291445_12_plen_101_part_00
MHLIALQDSTRKALPKQQGFLTPQSAGLETNPVSQMLQTFGRPLHSRTTTLALVIRDHRSLLRQGATPFSRRAVGSGNPAEFVASRIFNSCTLKYRHGMG